MTLLNPHKQHIFIGAFASEADALTEIRAKKWDAKGDGSGDPQPGMLAVFPDSDVSWGLSLRIYVDGYGWQSLGHYPQPNWNIKFTSDGGFAVRMVAQENLNTGEVVTVLAANDDGKVSKVPISGNENDMPIGVVHASASVGNDVWIVVSGKVKVLPESGVTAARGNVIMASTSEAGRVQQAVTVPAAATHFKECGHYIANGTGNGVATMAVVHWN